MKDENMITVPLVARMRLNETTGRYEIVQELSVYADIPAEAVAELLAKHFGLTRPAEGERP